MKIKFFFILILISVKFFATAQEPNKIIIGGKEYDLLNDPLESYFEQHPEDHPIDGEKIIKKNKKGEKILKISSGNWRGYLAYFEIKNNELYLVDLKIENPKRNKNDLISVYDKIFKEKLTQINYTGILTVPNGDFLSTDNFGFSHYYKNYILITFQDDKILKQKTIDNENYIKFKIQQFQKYQKTEEYQKEYQQYIDNWEESKKWDLSPENTKGLTHEEIEDLKNNYSKAPKKEEIDNFLFMTSNLEKIIIDY